MKSQEKSLKNYEKVYKSIDTLPYWNWEKIHDTGNLNYLYEMDSYRKIEKSNDPVLEEIFEEIYEEYIDEFGFSQSYIENLDTKIHIAKLKAKFLITGDRKIINHINVAENQLKIGKEESGLKLREVIIHIEKMQGVKMSVKTITVAEFFEYIKMLKWQTK